MKPLPDFFPDFPAYCEAACIKLWGEPDKRSKIELRWNGGDAYSVRVYSVRKRVWYDHGQKRGGSTLELVAYAKGEPAAQLRGAEFFEAWQGAYDQGWIPDPPPQPNGGGKPILDTYPYHDEQGVLLYEVVRFDSEIKEERFKQRRPDEKLGWIWKTKGIRQVLYRLPQLIAAVKAGKRILLPEGEKDANTAVKLGYAATTNPGGVGKWRKEYDEFFRGADVVIPADNDAPGLAFAEEKARRLITIAAQVRIVIFAQKDLTEWVAAGGTREQLDAIIELTEEFTPTAPPPPSPSDDDEAERLLAELNRDNYVVLDGGKTWVLRFEEMEHAAGGERYTYRVPTYLSFQAFRDFYLNRHIMVGKEKPKWVDIGSWWLTHPQRRQYFGVIFKPGDKRERIDGKLNLWRGWGVEPKPGDWSLMREHIFEVLAARDEAFDTYIMNWLAFLVQHPDRQAEVALTFLGDEGTGKGTLGKALCRIFGQHALHISSSDHLTGRFTGHIRQCCFLFADEAYAPGDKPAEGRFKRMVTEDTLTIEEKGRTPREEPNRLHIMAASNHEWVVPAGAHARRFAVGKVADTHRQEAAWFGPIYKQMQSGGWAAMLFDLLARDIGDWHPRQIVRTRALSKQQEESLSALDAWWSELLQTGVLAGSDELAPEKAISNKYEKVIIERSDFGSDRKRTVWRDGLYDQARSSSPKLKNVTDAALGRYLRDQGCKRARPQRRRGWEFPPLAECRKRWNERFPDTVWDEQVTEWETIDDD
jgi:hypothetical protein